jgi:Peptidase family M23
VASQTVPMQLPLAPKQVWKVTQGNNGTISHVGEAAFCWDFALPQGSSKSKPVYASAAGDVVDVHAAKGWFYVKHAAGEFCAYVHCLPASLKVKLGDRVQMGQELAQVGDTGTDPNNDHLHIALSNVVGKLEEEGGSPGFTTFAAKFSNYDVFNEGTQTWNHIPSGVPQAGQLIRRSSHWGPWTPLGGIFKPSAQPSAVSRRPTTIDILMRGSDDKLWQRSFVAGANPPWSNWMPHNDAFVLDSDPVVDSMAPDHLHVFALGGDHQLWQKWYLEAKGWSSWVPLGGKFPAAARPSAISRQPTITDIFMRGMDNRLWQKSFVGNANPPWTGWMPHNDGFELHSDPVVDSMAPNHLHVFALGADKQLWQKWYVDGKGWSSWIPQGGQFSEMSGGGVASRQPTITDILMRGMDNRLWQKSFVGGANPSWTGWMSHDDGFALDSDPAAVSTGADHLGVVALGADHQLWLKQWVSPESVELLV